LYSKTCLIKNGRKYFLFRIWIVSFWSSWVNSHRCDFSSELIFVCSSIYCVYYIKSSVNFICESWSLNWYMVAWNYLLFNYCTPLLDMKNQYIQWLPYICRYHNIACIDNCHCLWIYLNIFRRNSYIWCTIYKYKFIFIIFRNCSICLWRDWHNYSCLWDHWKTRIIS